MMKSTVSFLLNASKRFFIFLVALTFFHILIATNNPELFSDFYQLETWKEIIFSFRLWQILRNILWWIPLIWWIISGIYLLKLIRIDWNKIKLKLFLLLLLLYIFWPLIGYFIIKFNWWFTDIQKEYIKQFIVFWCYLIWIQLSRRIGAIMSDLIFVWQTSVRAIADSV